jgi:hypothetical protein
LEQVAGQKLRELFFGDNSQISAHITAERVLLGIANVIWCHPFQAADSQAQAEQNATRGAIQLVGEYELFLGKLSACKRLLS